MILKLEIKPSFGKHEKFYLRKGWLHKGIRNLKENSKLFSWSDELVKPEDALGIGTNMVKSLRYWLKATQMTEDDNVHGKKLTPICEIIYANDPYFEERGTNYLIHYLLASNISVATAWWWFFNEYKTQTIDKKTFVEDLGFFCRLRGFEIPNGLDDEFSTLIATYCAKKEHDDPEETKISPLSELRLITKHGKEEFKKTTPDKDDIHPYIAFAVICEKQKKLETEELQIFELLNGENNIGKIFNLDRSTIFYLIEKMEQRGLIKITRTAGLDVIKIKEKMTPTECLQAYYNVLEKEGLHD
ncbi:MAG: DUF4007 family protein [Christensenellaceae bacterium]|jgi:hypothetical protein|nr:DUF4007 family protein [Christensenellaceae bacterium]